MKLRVLFIFLVLFVTGCTVAPKQSYDGERLPPSQEAILSAKGKHSAIGFDDKIFISKVDGKSMQDIGARLAGQMFPYPHLVYIKPGRHTIEFTMSVGLAFSNAQVWFDAEPGKTYYAAGEIQGYYAKMWIENDRGEMVGGVGPANTPKK